MSEAPWRPASEAEAASARAAFLEWLQAVYGLALDGPAGLAAWRHERPEAFAAAMSAFAGLPEGADVRSALLRGHDEREALVFDGGPAGRRSWSRSDLRRAPALPEALDTMLAALAPADLPALAASHLLDTGTCPDTRLVWRGDPADPWPLGAWLVCATLVLPGPDADAGPGLTASTAPPGWRG
jgi:hypothetical protein